MDTSNLSKSAEHLRDLLDDMIDEVEEENVVKVVTGSALAYLLVGNQPSKHGHRH